MRRLKLRFTLFILALSFCFQSTVIVEKTVQDLMNLMHDLSAYSDQFLNMVCVKLQEYKDTCTLAYRYQQAWKPMYSGDTLELFAILS